MEGYDDKKVLSVELKAPFECFSISVVKVANIVITGCARATGSKNMGVTVRRSDMWGK